MKGEEFSTMSRFGEKHAVIGLDGPVVSHELITQAADLCVPNETFEKGQFLRFL